MAPWCTSYLKVQGDGCWKCALGFLLLRKPVVQVLQALQLPRSLPEAGGSEVFTVTAAFSGSNQPIKKFLLP